MSLTAVAIVTGSAVAGIVAVVAGTYLDDDEIRAPALSTTTAGDRNRHQTS